jgi:transglutaminase-like putative cysteine protease
MRFSVRHVTRFRYSRPVVCEPLTIRLRPHTNHRQQLLEYSIDIDPAPHGMSELVDLEGNDSTCVWFRGPTDHLTVTTLFTAQTSNVNVFQFLLRPSADQLPLAFAAREEPLFEAYASPTVRCSEVEELAHQIAREVDCATVPFVCRLNNWIYAHHDKIMRETGPAWRPAETLARRCGSCRDLAVVFMEACRTMNLPARFVSGYGAGTDDALDRQLHAWAEVYLPGAGWRGFDPSLGLAVTEQHLAVAVGRSPVDAAPTVGTFRGDAECQLDAEIDMQTSAGDAEPLGVFRQQLQQSI